MSYTGVFSTGVYRDSRHSSKRSNKGFGRYCDKEIRQTWNVNQQAHDSCLPENRENNENKFTNRKDPELFLEIRKY